MTTSDLRPVVGTGRAQTLTGKVPPATPHFWITKIVTTGMGEATSDYLVHRMNPVLAVALGAVGLLAALMTQFSVRRYLTPVYWLAVVMVAVFGTMAADAVHVALGVPYPVSTTAFALALAVVLAAWYRSEGTLSIHGIRTRRREAFYWATVMATFALGTAAGDLTASTVGLGYLGSGVMFAVIIAIPAAAYRWLRLDAVAAFWSAYVVTRPLGASFADWTDMPRSWGGLALGRGPVSLAAAAVVVGLVVFAMVTHADLRPGSGRLAGAAGARASRESVPGAAARSRGGRHRAGRAH